MIATSRRVDRSLVEQAIATRPRLIATHERDADASGCASLAPMVPATDFRERDDPAFIWRLHPP
jgi:hypothetical protein